MNDDKWTRIEYFEGGVSDFVALLLRLEARYPAGWTAPNGEILIVKPYKKYKQEELCEAWKAVPKKRPEWGVAILVATKEGQRTRVEFLDGFLPKNSPGNFWPPIGQAFEAFCEMLTKESPLLQTTPYTETQTTTPTEDGAGKLSGPVAIDAHERYVFRKRGEMWEIVYEGEMFNLADIKGLNFIAYLLASSRCKTGVTKGHLSCSIR